MSTAYVSQTEEYLLMAANVTLRISYGGKLYSMREEPVPSLKSYQ